MGKFRFKPKHGSKWKDVNSLLGNQFKKYKKKNKNNLQDQSWQTNKQFKVKVDLNNNQLASSQSSANYGKQVTNGLKKPSREDILRQKHNLPVYQIREQLITALKQHKTMILIGETASGKTTQVPQFVFEAKLNGKLAIAVTQPRRVAATSVSARVASEMNSELGQLVGYSVRFDDKTSPSTFIKFLTDGMLLREAISDPLLSKYSVVILDEAHERSIQTDVLLGIVKRAQSLRSITTEGKPTSLLKVVVMSATMDVDHFSKYFENAPVFYLQGRIFPIEKFYCSTQEDDYVQSALVTVLQIHRSHTEDGDILVFCTGQEEINAMVSATKIACNQMPDGLMKLIPLPLHASLPSYEQNRVFYPSVSGVSRKVIYSTNVAETSLTISGVRFVVDTCRVKARTFNPKIGFESLQVERISKAQAEQRAGRAGREGPGICFRLLTDQEFEKLKAFSIPEILRVNLSNVVLQLIAMGVKNILTFDFIDKPSRLNLRSCIEELLDLEGIEPAKDEDDSVILKVTPLGRQMVLFPLEPKFAKILVTSHKFGCTEEIIIILSMLYVDNIFHVPSEKRETASEVIKKFASTEGDHIKLLNVFRAYTAAKENQEWLRENFIHSKNMKIVKDVRKQLLQTWERTKIKMSSCGGRTEEVRRCLFSGLENNVAILSRDGSYRTLQSKQEVFIHPSSCLFQCKPEVVIYSDLVQTTKSYMRNLSLISKDWRNKTTNP